MNTTGETEQVILKGQDAVTLWLQGAEAWNNWVWENRTQGKIHFCGADFANIRIRQNLDLVSFEGFSFPYNQTIFEDVSFGEGDVSFKGVRFFRGVTFENCVFGEGSIHFEETHFDYGPVEFDHIDFGKGLVDFSYADFGEGTVFFGDSIFGEGRITFYGATANSGTFTMSRVKCRAAVDFSYLQEAEKLIDLSLYGSSFEESLILPSGLSRCIPDLRLCRLAAPLVLHHIRPSSLKEIVTLSAKIQDESSGEPEDIVKLRTLAEYAAKSHDHRSFLAFRAAERRYRRILDPVSLSSLASLIFHITSNDGQSLLRPIIGLLLTFLIFWLLFTLTGTTPIDALTQSTANSLPFLPASWQIPLTLTNLLQQGLSAFFLLLLGLGIWNWLRG